MNLYRLRIKFVCNGFTAHTYEHFEAKDVGQAVTKGLRHFEKDASLPADRYLLYLSAVFLRTMN